MQNNWCDILLSEEPLQTEKAIEFVEADNCGAINVFIGTVRNLTKTKPVVQLEFEAYQPMAIKEMRKIANLAKTKWTFQSIAIHHRVGLLKIGDIPVVIAVSSAHRKVAFEVCQFTIDTLKETVPIWKKEFFEDGAVWVAAHP